MDNNNCKCGCIGYAYVPIQELNEIFCPEEALNQASLFPELVITMEEYGKICTQCGGVM